MSSRMAASVPEPTQTESGVSGEMGTNVANSRGGETGGNAAGCQTRTSGDDRRSNDCGREDDGGELHSACVWDVFRDGWML
jgi:hypothetical protein